MSSCLEVLDCHGLAARRHASIHAITSRGSKRRGDAVQTRIRGGCSGGGWARASGHASCRREAMRPVAVRSGWMMSIDTPVKHMDVQAAMKMHLSQPTGIGALDGG